MHCQLAARPYCALAIFESVSPFCTVTFTSAFSLLPLSGTTISVPAAIRVGSTRPGLAASNSGQREPRPRCSSASFHSESPGCIVTMRGQDEVFATTEGRDATEGAATDGAITDGVTTDGATTEGATIDGAANEGAATARAATD